MESPTPGRWGRSHPKQPRRKAEWMKVREVWGNCCWGGIGTAAAAAAEGLAPRPRERHWLVEGRRSCRVSYKENKSMYVNNMTR